MVPDEEEEACHVVEWRDGLLIIKFGVQTVIRFSKHLAKLLGIHPNIDPENVKNIRKGLYNTTTEFNDAENLRNPNDVIIALGNGGYGGRYVCPLKVDLNYKMEQEFVIITSDFLKNMPIGHGDGKILKSIAIPYDAKGKYVTEHFDYLDYHPIQRYNFQEIDFKFWSVTGKKLEMRESEGQTYNDTHMNLRFKRFSKSESI